MKPISEFGQLLELAEKYSWQMTDAENKFLDICTDLNHLYTKGRGNGKQKQQAKEFLEEAGLL